MIVEILFPYNLKKHLKKLRQSGDLNLEAVRTLQGIPYVFLILWLISTVLCAYVINDQQISLNKKTIGLAIILFFMACFLMCVTVRHTASLMLVYLESEIKKGVVLSVHHKFRSPTTAIKIEEIKTKNVEMIGFFPEWYNQENCPEIGSILKYYSRGKGRHNNMPDQSLIREKYSLRKKSESNNYHGNSVS